MVSVKGVLIWSQKVWMVSTDNHHTISRTVHISPHLLFNAWWWVWKIIKIQEHSKALTFWISHPAIFSRERVFDDCIREVTANTPFSSSSTPRISSSVKLIPSAKNVSNAPHTIIVYILPNSCTLPGCSGYRTFLHPELNISVDLSLEILLGAIEFSCTIWLWELFSWAGAAWYDGADKDSTSMYLIKVESFWNKMVKALPPIGLLRPASSLKLRDHSIRQGKNYLSRYNTFFPITVHASSWWIPFDTHTF